jgi:hypothetical protein
MLARLAQEETREEINNCLAEMKLKMKMDNPTTPRYPKGQPMPSNVVHALLLTGKFGFLSRDLWNNFFARGSDRWRRQQLAHLVRRGYLKRHSNPEAWSTFVLGRRGIEFVKSQRGSVVTPPPVGHLFHDGVIAKSFMELQNQRLLKNWTCGREMKRDDAKTYLVSNRDGELKYPDSVFEIHAFGKPRTIALEYERERKAMSRYKAILRQYSGLTNISMVLFVYQQRSIKTTIEAAMKSLGQTSLRERLAFVDAEEWRRSPENAPITLGGTEMKLGAICKPLAEKKTPEGTSLSTSNAEQHQTMN